MGGRIRLTGTRNAEGHLVSVTFSNRSGGSIALPVRDEDQSSEQQDPMATGEPRAQRRMTLREWLATDKRPQSAARAVTGTDAMFGQPLTADRTREPARTDVRPHDTHDGEHSDATRRDSKPDGTCHPHHTVLA
jgi:hypothetical protein